MTSHQDDETAYSLPGAAQKQIFTYVKLANFLLNSYNRQCNTAKSNVQNCCLKIDSDGYISTDGGCTSAKDRLLWVTL